MIGHTRQRKETIGEQDGCFRRAVRCRQEGTYIVACGIFHL